MLIFTIGGVFLSVLLFINSISIAEDTKMKEKRIVEEVRGIISVSHVLHWPCY